MNYIELHEYLEQYLEQMKKFTQKIKVDKGFFLEVSVKTGVYNKNGQLQLNYK